MIVDDVSSPYVRHVQRSSRVDQTAARCYILVTQTRLLKTWLSSQIWGWPDLPHHCDSHMISVTFDWHNKCFWWSEDIYREHVLVYTNHSFMTCCGYAAFTSTTIFLKYGVNPARRVGTLHPENTFGAPLPIIKEKYPFVTSVIKGSTGKRIVSDILWWDVHGLQTKLFFLR